MSVTLIAELCQNHLGDFKLVKEMVDEAVEAGATHIKIQHIYTKNLTFRPQFEEGLTQNGVTQSIKRPWEPEFERLKPLELSSEDNRKFVKYVESKGAVPLTTCFARCDIPAIKAEGFKAIKVASYDCASYQLLRELAEHFSEIFVSTGATFSNEIKKASQVLKDKNVNYTFLHCVTIYPTPLEEMHLSRLDWLKGLSQETGFSDHSLVSRDGVFASKAAIAVGAKVVERHFTVLEEDESKDGPVSIRPEHLRELKRFSELSNEEQFDELNNEMPQWKEILLGNAGRKLSHEELLNRDYYRGRFASPRESGKHQSASMIYNWEETGV
ncbi:MAG: N-acetylneuraminate synthase family protein [Balneolaceae bacterium]|nr:N-acetylneuraminate synthase family protein [Balneolaceae bacterium]